MKQKRFFVKIFLLTMGSCFLSPVVWAEEVNSVSLLTTYVSIEGDEKMFQQNLWMDRNFYGGIDDLILKKDLGAGKNFSMEANALSDNDYRLLLNLTKEEFGYMTLKYDQFRKYYDDSGLYHINLTAGRPAWYELGRHLYTDRSDFSLDFGLTIPDRPKYSIGYEHKTKSGEMARGAGNVYYSTGDTTQYYQYPWSNNIDWSVDTLKLGTEFILKGFNVSLNQRIESYTNDMFRDNMSTLYNNSVTNSTSVKLVEGEEPGYKSATTTLLADKQVNERIYMKGGYLYSNLDGKIKWERKEYTGAGVLSKNYYDGEQNNDLNNNVFSWGMNFKPFKDLLLTSRLRYENSRTKTSAQYTYWDSAKNYIQDAGSNVDQSGFGEGIGLQYRAIPRTTFYADLDLEQIRLKYLEKLGGTQLSGTGLTTYERDSDVEQSKDTYTIGINSRPIKLLFISGRYRRINKVNDYTDYTDNIAGYPGWMGDNSRATDEYSIRTEIKPNKLSAFSVKYQNNKSAYDLSRDNYTEIAYSKTQTTSLGVTLTPNPKLYINTIYSFQDSMLKTKAADLNTFAAIAYYNGDSDSSLTTVNYAVNDKTNVSTQYQMWVADKKNAISQMLTLAMERSLKQELLLKLGYSYYTFDNDENTGIDDYKANLVSISLGGRF